MRFIFIVNPISGKGKSKKLIPELQDYIEHSDIDGEVYVTDCSGDALKYTKETAARGEPVRFYACGGDGTLFEVVNGAYMYDNAEVGAVPVGSGNDFVKYFSGNDGFLDIDRQVRGSATSLDLIKCGDKVSANICSFGFDADVAANFVKFKKWPLVSGSMAYTISIMYCLFSSIKNRFEITVDGKEQLDGSYLLALAANSKWYGGGIKAAPNAVADDGLLDMLFISTLSRFKIPVLLNKYKTGNHLSLDICHPMRGRRLHIKSPRPMNINMDGEIMTPSDDVSLEVLPKALHFIVP